MRRKCHHHPLVPCLSIDDYVCMHRTYHLDCITSIVGGTLSGVENQFLTANSNIPFFDLKSLNYACDPESTDYRVSPPDQYCISLGEAGTSSSAHSVATELFAVCAVRVKVAGTRQARRHLIHELHHQERTIRFDGSDAGCLDCCRQH